ncbi:MAG: hypothetical protein EA402_03525 [Planctomycetota bacterium]|nr:MAG: hypothetical protein EA402_03525 [Planctomycetota bacterium]
MNSTAASLPLPFPRTWWVVPGRVLGGCYPGDPDPHRAEEKLRALFAAGIRRIICLQQADEVGRGGKPFVPYRDAWQALGGEQGHTVQWQRFPIPDMDIPQPGQMREILAAIDASETPVYIHCWGGHGRTGTVAGCYLLRQGCPLDEVFERMREARAHDAHLRSYPCPQTDAQREVVRACAKEEAAMQASVYEPESAPVYQWWQPVAPVLNRPLGALLGLACGDALGTTLEFTRPGPLPWQALLTGPHTEITGGGPFRLVAGQVTDDTHMACCLAASLAAHHGVFQAQDVASRYATWSRAAFDIGGQTRAALTAFTRHVDPSHSGLAIWRDRGRQAAGNGALMRCAPIAVLIPGTQDAAALARRQAAIDDALITHADPRCCLASACLVAAIAAGIQGATPETMHATAQDEIAPAARLLRHIMPEEEGAIAAAEADMLEDLHLATTADPDLYGAIYMAGAAMGFVRVAFRLAFWELLHAPSYAAGVIDAVNRGGDADTNGAIVGALLGAHYGMQAIPSKWLAAVLDCQPGSPWDGDWHPRAFYDLLTTSH